MTLARWENETLPWLDQAACRGHPTSLFFPDDNRDRTKTGPPKRICGECPVQIECLAYAVPIVDLFGIWGGTTPEERRALRRARSRV